MQCLNGTSQAATGSTSAAATSPALASSHSGQRVNHCQGVLTHARARFPDIPLYGVFGGFHLSGITEPIIQETVEALAQFDLQLISPGHCTGWRAVSALASAFGEKVVPSAVGKTFTL